MDRFFQNSSGVNSPNGWICVRKPMADIRKSQRSKNGIRQRMGQAIGIRMPLQPHLAGNRYATQHKGATHNQTVNVVSVANSHPKRLDDTPKSVQFILDQIAGSSKDELRILLKTQCGFQLFSSQHPKAFLLLNEPIGRQSTDHSSFKSRMILGHSGELGSNIIRSIKSLDSHVTQSGGNVIEDAGDLWMSCLVFLNPVRNLFGKRH